MMNPFIASLMQQAEQASKEAVARQQQGSSNLLGMAAMMGGFGGGEGFGGGFGSGAGAGAGIDVPSMTPTLAAYSPPTAPIEPTYTPRPVTPPKPPTALGVPPIAPQMPKSVPPLSSDYTASMVAPPKSAAEVAAGVLNPAPMGVLEEKTQMNAPAVPPIAPNPMSPLDEKARMNAAPPPAPLPPPQPKDVFEETALLKQAVNAPAVPSIAPSIVPEGISAPTAEFTAQKALYEPRVPSIVPVAWDTSRAPLDGVDPNIIQAFEEAANAVNAAADRYVPTLEMWSGNDGHSRNHLGPAADIGFLDDQGVALNWNDPWVQDWTVEAARRGMRQLGAGPTYMKRYGDGRVPIGGDRIHAGGITPGYDSNNRVRVWSDSDPEWGSDYAGGITGQQEWLARLNAAINDPVALGTPIPAMTPEAAWWEDAPMGGQKVGVDEIAGLGGAPTRYSGNYTPQNETERTVMEAFEAAGYDPIMGLAYASIESGLNPGTQGGNTYWGLFQNDRNAMESAGLDWSSAADSTRYALDNMGKTVPYFQRKAGRDPEPYEIYLLHQQGIAGGTGIARWPDIPAWEAIQRQVAEEGGSISEAKAKSHIRGNIPSDVNWVNENSTAGDFAQMWRQKFDSHYAKFGDPSQVGGQNETLASPAVPPVVPSTQAGSVDPNWTSPYNNRNMAIFGGVKPGGGLWHDWDSGHRWAHDNAYGDYSQMYREFTYEPKSGYVPVGERDGRTVYAAPGPEYIDGNPVSREGYWTEARNRGALIPTESEMRALYEQAQAVTMPTIPNGGRPNDRISFDNVPDGPWYGPKEFYRTNDSPALPIPANLAEAIQSNPAILAEILYGGF